MQSSTCKFLMGLGLGSVVGAIMYRCSKTDKAKEWKRKMCCAAQSAADKAGEWMTGAKEKASDVAEKMADHVADKAETVAQKAEEAKNKFHSYSGK